MLPVVNRILGAPNLSILADYRPIGSIEIYDYKDQFVGVLQGKEDRQVVKLSQIADSMKQALLAAEDNDFFHHSGFSVISVLRALITNIKAGHIVQGGSTISQQMVKNLFIKEDERYKRTMTRKILELLIAFEVEQKFSKEKILEIYLNQVYFGNQAYGIERAAHRYFSKSAAKLNIEESAYLAGLLTAPSYLAKNLNAAMKRQNYVLDKMYEQGYINKKDYQKAKSSKLQFKRSSGNLSLFPYYFSYVEQQLTKRFNRNDLKSTGLKVYTGLDPVAQRIAEESMEIGIANAAAGINQAALVSIDVESAEIRALVGGVGNFWEYQYNRATNPHTIGSAFKPFVYLTAFMEGAIDPSSIIEDEPISIPDGNHYWTPKNFDGEFHGSMTARAALVFSRNVPAIKVAMKAGMQDIVRTAKAAGISTEIKPLLSMALGAAALTPLEVATAYSTFARGGVYVEPILIRKITDAHGKTLEVNRPLAKNSLPEIYVGQLVSVMEDVVNYGTGAMANIPERAIAGKTGTADGSRDIWFIGFTPDYVTAVWCGNERNREVLSRYATGGSTPAWIWKEFTTKYYDAKPKAPREFSFSDNYKVVAVDPLTGLLADEHTPNPVFKRFAPGTEPTETAPAPDGLDESKESIREKFNSLRKKMSDEDKHMRTMDELKRNNSNESSDEKFRVVPKPKQFKIEGGQSESPIGEPGSAP